MRFDGMPRMPRVLIYCTVTVRSLHPWGSLAVSIGTYEGRSRGYEGIEKAPPATAFRLSRLVSCSGSGIVARAAHRAGGCVVPRPVPPARSRRRLHRDMGAPLGKLEVDSPAFTDKVVGDPRFLVDEVPLLALVRHAIPVGWTRDPVPGPPRSDAVVAAVLLSNGSALTASLPTAISWATGGRMKAGAASSLFRLSGHLTGAISKPAGSRPSCEATAGEPFGGPPLS